MGALGRTWGRPRRRFRYDLVAGNGFVALGLILLKAEQWPGFTTGSIITTTHFAALVSLPMLGRVIHLLGAAAT